MNTKSKKSRKKEHRLFYYDFKFTKPISESDLEQIESEMKKIVKSKQEFIRDELSKKDALKLFKKQSFKVELIESAESSEGVSSDYVSTYRNEQFVDLCMGPHIPNTRYSIQLARSHSKLNKSTITIYKLPLYTPLIAHKLKSE